MTSDAQQPSDLFEDRKKAAENKYRLEQAVAFRVKARGAKLTGQWAAEKLGLAGQTATDYAAQVVGETAGPPGAVERKVATDLNVTPEEVAKRLIEFQAEARRQILDDIAQGRIKIS